MPEIKLKHVCSVSSEDPNHPADNLLGQETYRKWQCDSAGEKQAVVVIEFDKASVIHSVDIGNNGSAFIEVLVGNSLSSSDYEVLVMASSFMSPVESKSWTNINRVRMFGKDKLSKAVCDQKWDRVKLVCTQPFNKNEKYGISFVKFLSPPTASKDGGGVTEEATPPKKIGIFDLKSEPKAGGTLLFKKEPTSMAAKARQASIELSKDRGTGSSEPSDKSPSADRKRVSSKADKDPVPLPSKKAKASEDQAALDPILFEEIMKGVVFSLSGFQNPLRGNLREKGLEMGAEYEPDWGQRCTHLISAFSGTPKFNTVKSKGGLIVKKEWLTDSYDKKKRQPASKYRFSTDPSEGKQYDKKERDIFSKVAYTRERKEEETKEKEVATKPPPSNTGGSTQTPPTEEDPYGGSTDEGSDMEMNQPGSEDYDTEDEIQRVVNSERKGNETQTDKSTESSKKKNSASLLNLADFFSDCVFLLYGDFSSSDMRLLTRYIRAYNGTIENYMSDKVTHVITQSEWDENFDQAKSENSSLVFVGPDWIFACHKEQAIVSCEQFAIHS